MLDHVDVFVFFLKKKNQYDQYAPDWSILDHGFLLQVAVIMASVWIWACLGRHEGNDSEEDCHGRSRRPEDCK